MITYPTYFLDVQGIDYIINFVHIFFEVILVSNINKKRAVMIIVTYRATVLSICCLKNPNFQGEFFISEFPKLFNMWIFFSCFFSPVVSLGLQQCRKIIVLKINSPQY